MISSLDFTALDFETATSEHESICQVGLVSVKNGIITKKYSSLVKPPKNKFAYSNINVHRIEPYMTHNAPNFKNIWAEIKDFIINQHVVCHNANFDLKKLEKTLCYYGIPIPNYTHTCTFKIFGKKLDKCCLEFGIEFNEHHDALEDALACSKLFLKYKEKNGIIIQQNKNQKIYENKKIDSIDLVPNFEIKNTNNPFYKKKVVFTGDLNCFSRKEAAHVLKELGADVNTSISKKTDIVILGNTPGPSKMKKILELNIKSINEPEFLKLLNLDH